jgi:ribonuclease D
MGALPIRRYEGPVHVIAGAQDLQHAMQDILHETVVGFDTETRPAFKVGQSYLPSLVQFATGRAVYILQAQQQDLFGAMREILSSENITKAGVSVTDDQRSLKKLFEFDGRSVVDLGHVARRHGLKQTGLRNLAGIFLGTRIPKGATTTNWAARRLTPQQITYAATDAWVCRELYLRFRELKMV